MHLLPQKTHEVKFCMIASILGLLTGETLNASVQSLTTLRAAVSAIAYFFTFTGELQTRSGKIPDDRSRKDYQLV